MQRLIIIICSLLICNMHIALAGDFAYRNNHIENNALTARAMSMGGAISAILDNPDGLLLNPSALIGIEKNRFSLKSETSMRDVRRFSYMGIVPIDQRNILSMAYAGVGVGNIRMFEDDGNDIVLRDIASYAEEGWFMGYAYKLDRQWSVGATAKHYRNTLNVDQSLYYNGGAEGNDFDLGSLYRMNNNTSFSAGFKNIGSALYNGGTLKWNNGYRESYDFGSYVGVSHLLQDQTLLLAMDIRCSKLFKTIVSLGAEYTPHPMFAARLGYSSLYLFSFGLGFNTNDIVIDYAFVPDFASMADNKHYISFSYSFDSLFADKRTYKQLENEAFDYDQARQMIDDQKRELVKMQTRGGENNDE